MARGLKESVRINQGTPIAAVSTRGARGAGDGSAIIGAGLGKLAGAMDKAAASDQALERDLLARDAKTQSIRAMDEAMKAATDDAAGTNGSQIPTKFNELIAGTRQRFLELGGIDGRIAVSKFDEQLNTYNREVNRKAEAYKSNFLGQRQAGVLKDLQGLVVEKPSYLAEALIDVDNFFERNAAYYVNSDGTNGALKAKESFQAGLIGAALDGVLAQPGKAKYEQAEALLEKASTLQSETGGKKDNLLLSSLEKLQFQKTITEHKRAEYKADVAERSNRIGIERLEIEEESFNNFANAASVATAAVDFDSTQKARDYFKNEVFAQRMTKQDANMFMTATKTVEASLDQQAYEEVFTDLMDGRSRTYMNNKIKAKMKTSSTFNSVLDKYTVKGQEISPGMADKLYSLINAHSKKVGESNYVKERRRVGRKAYNDLFRKKDGTFAITGQDQLEYSRLYLKEFAKTGNEPLAVRSALGIYLEQNPDKREDFVGTLYMPDTKTEIPDISSDNIEKELKEYRERLKEKARKGTLSSRDKKRAKMFMDDYNAVKGTKELYKKLNIYDFDTNTSKPYTKKRK